MEIYIYYCRGVFTSLWPELSHGHTISLEPSLKYKARVGVVGVVVRLRVLLDELAPP